jgi:hypothetical protein
MAGKFNPEDLFDPAYTDWDWDGQVLNVQVQNAGVDAEQVCKERFRDVQLTNAARRHQYRSVSQLVSVNYDNNDDNDDDDDDDMIIRTG